MNKDNLHISFAFYICSVVQNAYGLAQGKLFSTVNFLKSTGLMMVLCGRGATHIWWQTLTNSHDIHFPLFIEVYCIQYVCGLVGRKKKQLLCSANLINHRICSVFHADWTTLHQRLSNCIYM